jgi:hypothetical protein
MFTGTHRRFTTASFRSRTSHLQHDAIFFLYCCLTFSTTKNFEKFNSKLVTAQLNKEICDPVYAKVCMFDYQRRFSFKSSFKYSNWDGCPVEMLWARGLFFFLYFLWTFQCHLDREENWENHETKQRCRNGVRRRIPHRPSDGWKWHEISLS